MNKYKKIINQNWLLLKNFGLKITLIELLSKTLFKGDNYISHMFHKYKHENVKKYLRNKYSYLIEEAKYKKCQENEKIKNTDNIWVFWWQGINNAPNIVKTCIKSIKENSGKHNVIIVDKNNYKKYTNIPNYIIEKVNDGKITLTSFSDIVRMDLLYNNGGIWMDATIFMTKELDSNIYNYSLYTIKHNLYADWHVCKGKWTGFFLATNKGNESIEFFRKFFYTFLREKETFITYFLIDCIIAIGYEDIYYIKNTIDNIPINGEGIFELAKILSDEYDEIKYNKIIKNNTLHKLSYKDIYKLQNNGRVTMYKHFMEGENVT